MVFNSIRKKMMALLLIATIVPIMTSIVISYQYTKGKVTDKFIKENSSLLDLGKTNIFNYFDNMNRLSLSVYSGINKPESMYTAFERNSDEYADESVTNFISSRDPIYLNLLNIYQSNKAIQQIHMYVTRNQQSNLIVGGLFKREKNDAYSMPQTDGKPSKPFIEGTHRINKYGMTFTLPYTNKPEDQVITLHRPIYRTPTEDVIAYMSIDIRLKELREIASQLYNPGKESLYILDHEGTVVYAGDAKAQGTKLNEKWMDQVRPDAQNGHFEWKDNKFKGLILFQQLQTSYMNWTVVKQIPYEYLYEDATAVTKINSIIAAISLIIVVAGTMMISVYFTTPIKKLIQYVNHIQIGNMDAHIDITTNDEIGILAQRVHTMVQTINNLILKEYRLVIANKTNQLKALQAQINPHFLYNALQSIATLALHYQAPKIYNLITALGKMMRYNMNTEEIEVPLYNEIEHVKSYLELQKERFGDRLTAVWDIEEGTADIVVPKMLLQPIVENYFKHGFQGDELGQLRIQTKLTDSECLQIVVSDNGKGITAERLEQLTRRLNSDLAGPAGQEGGIGLANILARLKLHIGSRADMRIEGSASNGFAVTLMIPLTKEGD